MSSRKKSERSHKPEGLWDWLDLVSKLAIPFVVLGATIWFTQWQSGLADLQHQDDIVETYIADMNDLGNQGPGAAADSQTAEEQTITTLQRLNAHNNKIVLRFLQEAHLVGAQDPVIDLSNADLSHDDLSGTPLNGIDLKNANLSYADLSGADLSGAIMYSANLTGADLSGATLAGASLSSAILTGANLSGADLSSADLPGAAIAQSQVDVVRSCTDAIFPKGVTCQPICRSMTPSTALGRFATPSIVRICQQSPPIQLTYWYTETGAQATEVRKLVNEFNSNKQYSDIHVNAVQMDFFNALTAFTTAVQGGNAPDVFRSDVTWTQLLASKGYLLDIDPYMSQSDLQDYLNSPLSIVRGIPPGLSAPLVYNEYKGNLYGLPQVTNFLVLLYNQPKLKNAGITRAPTTMEQFKHDAVQIVQRKTAQYGFEFGGTTYYALPFIYACGGGMFDQHDNILVNNTGSVAGLNFLVNLQKVGKVQVMPQEQSFSTPPGTMVQDFMKGKTAMIFDGPQDINEILTSSGSVFNGKPRNLGIAAIPTGVAGQAGSPLGGESYVISAGTAHPAQAYKFIEFMSLTRNQAALANFAKAGDALPTLGSAYQHAASNYPSISTFLKPSIKDTVVAPLPVPEAAYLFDAADPDIWAALTGKQTAGEALNAIAYSWKQLGAGTLVSQYTSTPGTSPPACR
jgi:arabinogalactan oligomer / maltooligosaccharide transport system substrate-binding protein